VKHFSFFSSFPNVVRLLLSMEQGFSTGEEGSEKSRFAGLSSFHLSPGWLSLLWLSCCYCLLFSSSRQRRGKGRERSQSESKRCCFPSFLSLSLSFVPSGETLLENRTWDDEVPMVVEHVGR